MKILYFPKNSSNIFSLTLVFMQLSRGLDSKTVMLLDVKVLGMTLKGLKKNFLFGKAYLKKASL